MSRFSFKLYGRFTRDVRWACVDANSVYDAIGKLDFETIRFYKIQKAFEICKCEKHWIDVSDKLK